MSAIDWASIDALDDQLDNQFDGVSIAALKAVIAVESSGNGYNKDGSAKKLVEGHRAWKLLLKQGKDPATLAQGYEDVLYPTWTKEHYIGGSGENQRLERLKECAGEEIALLATSWGLGQVLGENYAACGYDDVFAYVDAVQQSHEKQVEAMLAFIRSKRLWQHLEGDDPDFAAFAKGYNGSGYRKNQYDAKMHREFRKFRQSPQEDFKPAFQSRRNIGTTVAGTGALMKAAAEQLQAIPEAADSASIMILQSQAAATSITQIWHDAHSLNNLGWVAMSIGLGFIIYSWWDDRRKGRT